jgi:hypothetical protein
MAFADGFSDRLARRLDVFGDAPATPAHRQESKINMPAQLMTDALGQVVVTGLWTRRAAA